MASQSSPWTKTFPCGDRALWVKPISPINPCTPVTTLLARAFRAMLIKKTVMNPSGILTASAVSKWTRISGIGASTSKSPPKVSVTMPPMASTPWAANLASRANRTKEAKIRTTAAKRVGSKFSAKSGEKNEDDSHCSGHDGAGMVELGVKSKRAHSEQDERYIRIEKIGQNALLQRHVKRTNRLADQIEGDSLAAETLHWLALQLFEQIVFVGAT